MPCLGLDPGAVSPDFKNKKIFSLNVQIATMKYLLNSDIKMADLKCNHAVYYRLTESYSYKCKGKVRFTKENGDFKI